MKAAKARIWIAGVVPNLNDLIRTKASRYKGAYNQLKKSWAHTVWAACITSGAREKFAKPVRLTFEWVEPSMRRDPDNFVGGGQKFVIDGLVTAGVLEGDGWKHIAAINHSWRVDKEHPGVFVTIEEAA
jgi:Holliday junction resolvase RusA-like endonuclease